MDTAAEAYRSTSRQRPRDHAARAPASLQRLIGGGAGSVRSDDDVGAARQSHRRGQRRRGSCGGGTKGRAGGIRVGTLLGAEVGTLLGGGFRPQGVEVGEVVRERLAEFSPTRQRSGLALVRLGARFAVLIRGVERARVSPVMLAESSSSSEVARGEELGGIEVGFVRADAGDRARVIEVRLVVATGGRVRLAAGEGSPRGPTGRRDARERGA